VRAARFVDPSGAERIGRLEETSVVDAGPAGLGGFVPSDEGWEAVASASGPEYELASVRLLHPVVPAKLIGIGLNYRSHADESELDVPAVPVVFAMWPSALVGTGAAIVVPRDETRPDYEGEVAIVLGRTVKNASVEEARSAIGGYTAFNDVSGRRAQLETPLRQFTIGKSFDTFAPMGPGLASVDEADLDALGVRTTVSGEVLQEANTRDLIFPFAELVAYCSTGITLEAGTVVATGTPGGVGDSRDPKRYLADGDVVEVWVEGAGRLANPVEREQA
jgi:2-keto-4-pentenoate hydratase/2-oxohepta-3-ene-1,7-dioic acid hydratase in catechol pathway